MRYKNDNLSTTQFYTSALWVMISRERNIITVSGDWNMTYLNVPSHPTFLFLEYQKNSIWVKPIHKTLLSDSEVTKFINKTIFANLF